MNGYQDIMGNWGQMDIIGQNGGQAYQCNPVGPMGPAPMPMPNGPVPPPPVAGALGFPVGYPGGPLGGYPLAAQALPFGAPGYAEGGWPVGFPGAAALGAYGPYGYPYGCFGPPVSPLLTQRVEEPAVLLRPRCPTRFRTQWLGFERTCIGGCETVTIECSVNVLTKIIRLVFPSDVAFQLLVHQIEIGNECLIQCGPIPASMFLEDATDAEEINTETIQPGTSVRITVQNVTKSDVCLSIGAKVRVAF